MKTSCISNFDSILDSRDVINRIKDLEDEREILQDAIDECPDDEDCKQDLVDWNDVEGDELAILKILAEEAEYSPDWHYGETLIRDSYFTEYAQQFAEDIGAIEDNTQWPCTCIDWELAASELQVDYMRVDFDGVDYWIKRQW